MTLDNINASRCSYWLSPLELQELHETLSLACLEETDASVLIILQDVIADLGIAEARLESNGSDSGKWRLALGKGEADTPVYLSRVELETIRPALRYATSDRLNKLLT